jgi:hypothetical protein
MPIASLPSSFRVLAVLLGVGGQGREQLLWQRCLLVGDDVVRPAPNSGSSGGDAQPLPHHEAARSAARVGLPLPADRHAAVAATAHHIHSVVTVLRELDFGDLPPALAYRAEQEIHDAAL